MSGGLRSNGAPKNIRFIQTSMKSCEGLAARVATPEKAPRDRTLELIEIRKALQGLGLFHLPEFAERAKAEMNAYVRDGRDREFRWNLENGDRVVVTLRGRLERESGVTVEQHEPPHSRARNRR